MFTIPESTVLTDSAIADKLRVALTENKSRPAVWVKDKKLEKLRVYLFPDEKTNPDSLSKDADVLAKNAGFSAPKGTRTLLV